MKEYLLFLDESKPNTNFQNFTLGGIIVEREIYETLVKPKIIALKQECFYTSNVILHEIDIRKKEGSFKNIDRNTQIHFFNCLRNIFKEENDLKVLAVSINLNGLTKLYKKEDLNDIYYIALQLLMENFT